MPVAICDRNARPWYRAATAAASPLLARISAVPRLSDCGLRITSEAAKTKFTDRHPSRSSMAGTERTSLEYEYRSPLFALF